MGQEQHAELIAEALAAQQELMHALQRTRTDCWTRLDLTMSQLKAVMTLDAAGELTIGGLAGLLGIGRPAASLLVEGLVQHDLVRRAEDPSDRRRAIVRLSKRGEAMLAELSQLRRDHLSAYMSQLGRDDLLALVRGLRALTAVVQDTAASSLSLSA